MTYTTKSVSRQKMNTSTGKKYCGRKCLEPLEGEKQPVNRERRRVRGTYVRLCRDRYGATEVPAEVFVFLADALFMFVHSTRHRTTIMAGLLGNANWITRLGVVAAAICLSIGRLCAATEAPGVIRYPVSIAPQELAQALQVLAKDRDFQLVYRSEIVNDRRTNGASGVLTVDETLTQLLVGTGLMFRYLDHNAITIVRSE